jgi:hypothetical protein
MLRDFRSAGARRQTRACRALVARGALREGDLNYVDQVAELARVTVLGFLGTGSAARAPRKAVSLTPSVVLI